jgi:hypothetical protein
MTESINQELKKYYLDYSESKDWWQGKIITVCLDIYMYKIYNKSNKIKITLKIKNYETKCKSVSNIL